MTRLIRTTYAVVTPESASDGDYAETGWIDETGESMELDEYDAEEELTITQKAIDFLRNKGAYPSSSHFSPGTWYSTEPQIEDYSTNESWEYSYHLCGFTESEEETIFNAISR